MPNLSALKSGLLKALEKPMVRHTAWMMMAQGARLVIQAVYFVAVARTLGVQNYGIFAGVSAFTALVGPFANWGGGPILVKKVSRDRSLFAACWGNALLINVTWGVALVAMLTLLSQWILPTVPRMFVFLVVLSELVFTQISMTGAQAFTAHSLLNVTAQINVLLTLKNLFAVFLLSFLVGTGIDRLIGWGACYLASSLVLLTITLLMVSTRLGRPKPDLAVFKPEFTEGFYFSFGLVSQSIYNDVDKAMLIRMQGDAATGIYASAYRLVLVSMSPVQAILSAAYARFFKDGEGGVRGTLKLAKKLTPIAGLYGGLGSLALAIFAPVVPVILGDEYSDAVGALRWLSPILFIKSLQYFAANTLMGAGLQGIRSMLQASTAVFNAIANYFLIMAFSWKGAAWSSLASDGMLMLSLWGLVFYFNQREKRQAAELGTD